MTECICKLRSCLPSWPPYTAPTQYLCMRKGSLQSCQHSFNSAIHHVFPFGECAGVYCKESKKRGEKKRTEKMETNVIGLNAWTADGEEDGDRQTVGEETEKNKADTERERGQS